jgi:hypothetical protein
MLFYLKLLNSYHVCINREMAWQGGGKRQEQAARKKVLLFGFSIPFFVFNDLPVFCLWRGRAV